MNKRVKIAAIAILVCIFVTVSVLFVISEINHSTMDVPEAQIVSAELTNGEPYPGADAVPGAGAEQDTDAFKTTTESSPLDDGRYYVLRDSGGYLGIFSPADPSRPELITAVRTDSLRNADIERVKIGITVRGFENLLKLLEDFSS